RRTGGPALGGEGPRGAVQDRPPPARERAHRDPAPGGRADRAGPDEQGDRLGDVRHGEYGANAYPAYLPKAGRKVADRTGRNAPGRLIARRTGRAFPGVVGNRLNPGAESTSLVRGIPRPRPATTVCLVVSEPYRAGVMLLGLSHRRLCREMQLTGL